MQCMCDENRGLPTHLQNAIDALYVANIAVPLCGQINVSTQDLARSDARAGSLKEGKSKPQLHQMQLVGGTESAAY